MTLSGANTYTGTTTINGGGLTLTDSGAIAGSDITVGSNSAANMTIESGAMVTSNGAIYVGLDSGSNGTLNITGGTVNAYWLRPGRNTGSKGVINISGGVVTISKPSSVSGYNEAEIGHNGSGKITVSGTGKLTFTGSVRIANMGQAESYINIEDYGEVTVNTELYVGQRGSNLGTMTLSGHAKLTVNNGLQIGTNSASKGSGAMTLKDDASVTLSGSDIRSHIGYDGGTSTLNVSDNATFTAQGKGLLVGNTATGVINQTGGTITLKPMEGAVFLADGNGGKANLNISGGKFNIKKTLIAGTRGAATIVLSKTGEINADATVVLAPGYETGSSSTVNQTGGTFNANAGIVYGNYFANRGTGVYNLSGGTLNTTSITYGSQTPSSAQFNLSENGVANVSGAVAVPTTVSGGTLNANSIDIPANGTLTISDGTINLGEGGITAEGAYTINLSGGTFATKEASWSTSLNATVAVNSTITFAPESGQTITWEGALTGNGDILKTGEGRLKINYDNDNSEVVKFDVDNFTVSSGQVDIKGYMYSTLSVEGPNAVFSPGNSVGDAVFGGGFILKEGATLLIEQEDDRIDTLTASSFNIDSNSFIELTADSLQPGVDYPIIVNSSGDFGEVDGVDYSDPSFWNGLLTPESANYWNLNVVGNTVYATANAPAAGVPEPSTWALLLLGAAGLLYVRKRTRQ